MRTGKKLGYLELKILLIQLVWNFEFERCPEPLRGYEAEDFLTHSPQKCFVKLRVLRHGSMGMDSVIGSPVF